MPLKISYCTDVLIAGKAGSIEVFRGGNRIATLVNITSYDYNTPEMFQ